MTTFKPLALAASLAAGLTCLAAPASADLWHSEQVLGRSITFYSPPALDRQPIAPLVLVFDDTAASGGALAERFALWHYAKEAGFKTVFAGNIVPGAKGNGVPSNDALFPMSIEMSLQTGHADPENLYVVGFGAAAQRAYDFACQAPGVLRGIVAIDHDGAGEEGFACDDTGDLLVLSVHDGVPAVAGKAGGGASRDTEAVDAVLDTLRNAGATVQSVVVEGNDAAFPSIAAKLHEQTGISLEKLVATFVDKTMK